MNNISFKTIWDHITRNGQILTTYVNQPLGVIISMIALKIGLSANVLTILATMPMMISLLIAIYCHLKVAIIFFMICSQISYSIDCSDGQVARYLGSSNNYGAFLDLNIDRVIHVIWGITLFKLIHQQQASYLIAIAAFLFVSRWLIMDVIALKSTIGNIGAVRNPKADSTISMILKQFTDASLLYFIVPIALWLDIGLILFPLISVCYILFSVALVVKAKKEL